MKYRVRRYLWHLKRHDAFWMTPMAFGIVLIALLVVQVLR